MTKIENEPRTGLGYTRRETPGRVEVLPHAVPEVLLAVTAEAVQTMWPDRVITDRLEDTVEHVVELAHWTTARCLALLSYLAADRLPAGEVLDRLLDTPRVYVSDANTEYEREYVPMHVADELRADVALPAEVWALLNGRIVHALRDWPPTTAEVITDLVAVSAPAPVEGESAQNRAYGAQLASRLFAGWVAAPAVRWPLAAAWASANLLHQWVSFGATVPEERHAYYVGLAPYSSHMPIPDGTVLPDWSDLIPAVQA